MKDYLSLYKQKTPKSHKLYERAKAVIPGGICHNLRYHPPYPCYISHALGSKFWDIDGNEYLDFWQGHYTHILGHANPYIKNRMAELVSNGMMNGIINPLEVELAELVCELIPSAQKVRFCCSGTEASMYAVRLARSYTKRNKIIKIQGGWHGANSDLLYAVQKPYEKPDSLGLPNNGVDQVIAVTFNNTDMAIDAIRKHADDLACIILEPVSGVGGFIAAEKEFLSAIRKETYKAGALLIYDEIISGFRVALGGAQELLGVVPDITVLGKILGGGQPIGAAAGAADIMDICNPNIHINKWERAMVGGGTFSCMPASMAAGIAMLGYLRQHAETIYPQLAKVGENLRLRIEKAFGQYDIYAKCTGVGSLFMTHFPINKKIKIDSPYAANYLTDVDKREVELKTRLLAEGVYVMHGGGAVSTEHTGADLDSFIEQITQIAAEMKG